MPYPVKLVGEQLRVKAGGTWRKAITRSCLKCGATFHIPSNLRASEGSYCSRRCTYQAQADRNYAKRKIIFCQICGKGKRVKKSHASRIATCGPRCSAIHRSRIKTDWWRRNEVVELSKQETMKDDTVAWLTASGNYYARRYRLTPKTSRERPDKDRWTHIAYYTLEGERVPLAKAECAECGDVLESKHCGDFVVCKCGQSSVDTDRWFPERHRYLGHVKL